MRQNTSLKDRRRIVRSVLDRVRARHNVAVADLGPANDRQRAALAFTCVGSNQRLLERVLDAVLQQIESNSQAEVLESNVEIR